MNNTQTHKEMTTLVAHPKQAMKAMNMEFTNESFSKFVHRVYDCGETLSTTQTLWNGQKVIIEVRWSEVFERFAIKTKSI